MSIQHSTTELANAAIVVAGWRSGRHPSTWGEPARSLRPSTTTTMFADAWADVREAADRNADDLIRLGYRPEFETIKALRSCANDAAKEEDRARRWADALRLAEDAPQEGQP